jgi:TadE-like protein
VNEERANGAHKYSFRAYKTTNSQSGQSMIEFALSIPFLLLILVSILFFGRYFLITQVLLYAAQQGAKVASSTANLTDDNTRNNIRGFFTGSGGGEANNTSVIYTALASANLLSKGNSGDLPIGAKVEILPWDSNGSTSDTIPAGTVEVRIDYPFQLIGSPFNSSGPNWTVGIAMTLTNNGSPLDFFNFIISQRAVAAQQIYQQ